MKNELSFIIPSRTNLKYFKWAYNSIRANQGDYDVWICAADDASTDGTSKYFKELATKDSYFRYMINDTGQRRGHTYYYDAILKELVTTDIAVIWHCDMYLLPNCIHNMIKHMDASKHTIISATRIEPKGLHPAGPEKYLFDTGEEPEVFKEQSVLDYAAELEITERDKITNGFFAPWMFFKSDFVTIGGHSALYLPQSREDSDIANRFVLAGYTLIQSRDAFVAHLTCRGSRYNPTLTTVGIESSEWLEQNKRSTRNFIRKWGTMVRHDKFMMPIIPNKYDIGIVLTNSNLTLLSALEPHCYNIYIDNMSLKYAYINEEQKNTIYDLNKRIDKNVSENIKNEIILYIDGHTFNQNDYSVIDNIASIIGDGGDIGKFEIGNILVEIRALNTYQHQLIKCNNNVFKS